MSLTTRNGAAGAAAPKPPLVVRHLRKEFGENVGRPSEVISDISITLAQGEIVALVGPSGCDKSPLLNLLCDLMPRTRGDL